MSSPISSPRGGLRACALALLAAAAGAAAGSGAAWSPPLSAAQLHPPHARAREGGKLPAAAARFGERLEAAGQQTAEMLRQVQTAIAGVRQRLSPPRDGGAGRSLLPRVRSAQCCEWNSVVCKFFDVNETDFLSP